MADRSALWATIRLVADVYTTANARNTGLLSAGVAFFAFLAVFPGLAAFISVFGAFADPTMLNDQLALMEDFLPPAAYVLLETQITRLIWANEGVLGWASLISATIALFLARRGVDAMLVGLCAIHGAPRRKGVIHAASVVAITLGMLVVGVIALLSVLVLPVALAIVPLGGAQVFLLEAIRWLVSLSLVALWIGVFYKVGPNRPRSQPSIWKPGLVAALVLWLSASAGFSFYIKNFGNYNEIYGSIGAVIALLMWFYISAYAVLLGGVLNATLEKAKGKSAININAMSDETSPRAKA
jgi:membrane protein